MNSLEFNKNGARIKLYGNTSIILCEKEIIENLNITGIESKDRLTIQECIDKNKLKSKIYYEGNNVHSYEKIVKEYRKLQKSGSLENLNNIMYDFFVYSCGDSAHYDINGFRWHYDNSFRNLENKLLSKDLYTGRFSDRDKIFKELKIGKYYNERENIDINEISVNELKKIIKESNWNINKEKDNWKISKSMPYNKDFSFYIDVSNKDVKEIYCCIARCANIFDENDYAEKLYKDKENNLLIMKEMVNLSENIKQSLKELKDNVLYKCRILADEKNYNSNNIDNQIEKESLVM